MKNRKLFTSKNCWGYDDVSVNGLLYYIYLDRPKVSFILEKSICKEAVFEWCVDNVGGDFELRYPTDVRFLFNSNNPNISGRVPRDWYPLIISFIRKEHLGLFVKMFGKS